MYVLEGEIEYSLGDEHITALPGSFVFVPAGVPHKFCNFGSRPARHIVIVSPREVIDSVEALGKVTPEEMAALWARYDSTLIAED